MNFDITASRTTHVPEPSRCPEVLTVNTNDRVHRDAPIINNFICIALFRELKDTLQGSKKKKKKLIKIPGTLEFQEINNIISLVMHIYCI